LRRLWPSKQTWFSIALLATAFAVAVVSGWTSVATQIDDAAYDWMFRLHPPVRPAGSAVILAIDDASYNAMGGQRALRSMLAMALDRLEPAYPRAVAIDVVLSDSEDHNEDQRLEGAMKNTHHLVLVTDLAEGRWQNPLPGFRRYAAGVGHDKSDENSQDGVTRRIPLEERTAEARYWALALETFRVTRGQKLIPESPGELQVGAELIPAARTAEGNRPLRVLFTREPVPQVSLKDLAENPQLASAFAGKTVFIGATSITGAQDRVRTPFENGRIPGVEVHAQLFDTLEHGEFLTDASDLEVLGFCAIATAAAGLIFAFLTGWTAYLAAALLLMAAHVTPYFFFTRGVVFPYFSPLASAWLACAAAASFQHFVVRRQLRRAETDRQRYQQAIHFVTHEMRTPLTAIQGSSELMGRYQLTDEKRKQIAEMINQESKRLARMIQTFLDVERLSDGQMDLKREPFEIRGIVASCVQRAQPLAERKNIAVRTEELDGALEGDRELMEYAVYNLLTNAIKYSGPDTEVKVACRPHNGKLRLSVADQGIGMDAKELRQIFQKFYRTKRAEASGEAGTGIGLSIVEQIVHLHSGELEVASSPGKGSCFTVVLPACSLAAR
jgi:signal transduction histidine kinase